MSSAVQSVPHSGQAQGQVAAQTNNSNAPATSGNSAAPQSSHSSLYVGDLNPDVNEAQIYEKFGQVGQILSIRVCRDMITRKSLCYAYVNFHLHEDAEKAFENLNFEVLIDRPMRIMWSQRDPAIRKSGVGNVYIKNLDKKISSRELFDTLCCFGKILSLKIAFDEKGHSKGYGFVHFSTEEAAKRAIEKMNGMKIEDKLVTFCEFVPKKKRVKENQEVKFNNVYVKNFGDDVTDDTLKEVFSEYGEIISAKVMTNSDGKSKGFGFCSFKHVEDAAKAVTALNNSTFRGRTLFAGRAQKKAERLEVLRRQFEVKTERPAQHNTGVNLYVKNLDDQVDDQRLHEEFAKFGTITSCKVMTDQNGRSKGFGFVCFSSAEEASAAVSEMNYKMMMEKPIYVALAQKKEERRAQLSLTQAQRNINNMRPGPANPMIPPMFSNPNINQFAAANQGGPNFFANQANMFHMQHMMPGVPGGGPGGLPSAAPAGFNPSRGLNPAAGQGQFPGAQNLLSSFGSVNPQAGGAGGLGNTLPNQFWANRGAAPQMRPNAAMFQQLTSRAQMQQTLVQHQQQQQLRGAQAMQQMGNRPAMPTAQQMQPRPPVAQAPRPMQPAIQPGVGAGPALSREHLANLNPEDRRQVMGEHLYTLLHDYVGPEHIGKVTGMLLASDERDLYEMLTSSDRTLLHQKADEAKQVYLKRQAENAAAGQGAAGNN